MAKRRSSMLPLALIGAGAVALVLSRRSTAPVNGVGALGFSIKSVAKKVSGAAKKVGRTVSRVDPSMRIAKKLVTSVAKKSPDPFLKKFVAKVSVGGSRGRRPQPKPGEQVEYQDENGNPISKAEFERRQAEYDRQAAAQQHNRPVNRRDPADLLRPGRRRGQKFQASPGGQGTPIIPQIPSNEELLRQMREAAQQGGGGSAPAPSPAYEPPPMLPPSSATPPPSVPEQALSPTAPKKVNPLVTAAAFIAVPAVMLMTGGK